MSEEYGLEMSEAILMPGFEEHVSEIAGSEMRYFAGGSGAPVVLVHGLSGSATNWTELAPILARRRRVLVPDLPGHGRSAPATAPEGLGSLADRVAALAEREGMLPAVLVGHSMGADIAVQLAVRLPEAVTALVLVSAGGISAATTRGKIGLTALGILRPSRLAAHYRRRIARSPALRRLVFKWWGADDPAALSAEVVLGFLEGPAHARDTATAGRAVLAADVRRDLARVSCPSLVVWGARDNLTPLADGFEYARRLRARMRTLAGAGHLVIGERPAECAAILERFLDGIGEVDELPLEAELARELRRESANT